MIEFDDALGYLSDNIVSKVFDVDRKAVAERRQELGRKSVRTDNWSQAVNRFGFDEVLETLLSRNAPEPTIRSLRRFRALGSKRTKSHGRIRRHVSSLLSNSEKAFRAELGDWQSPPLPATRGDCEGGNRPCPMVRCKYHLALDYYSRENGRVGIIISPDLLKDPVTVLNEMKWTCLLDAIDANDGAGYLLEDVGLSLDLTKERVHQVEEASLEKLEKLSLTTDLGDSFDIRKLVRR